MIDLTALTALTALIAKLGDPVARLSGFLAVAKSSALYPIGIQIVYHVDPVAKLMAIEYRPRHHYVPKPGFIVFDSGHDARLWGEKPAYRREQVPGTEGIPRIVVYTYEEQCAVHRALGLHVVRRGDEWRPLPVGQMAIDFGEERDAA
ncbi:MAG: hypothetical protein HY816_20250 [Candidatus Wallbacteria bacterium]|nr:hypothetical protein [Candidatus Wallbacteria bacterium]